MNLEQAEKVWLLLPPDSDLADLRETLAKRIDQHKHAIATAAQELANLPTELSLQNIRFEFRLHKSTWSSTWQKKLLVCGGKYSDCRGTSYRFLSLPILGDAIGIAEELIKLELTRTKSVTIRVSSRSFTVHHRDDVAQVYDHATAVAQACLERERDQLTRKLDYAQQHPIYLG